MYAGRQLGVEALRHSLPEHELGRNDGELRILGEYLCVCREEERGRERLGPILELQPPATRQRTNGASGRDLLDALEALDDVGPLLDAVEGHELLDHLVLEGAELGVLEELGVGVGHLVVDDRWIGVGVRASRRTSSSSSVLRGACS